MPTKITVQRGLTTLKTLTSKIEGANNGISYAVVKTKDALIKGLYTADKFREIGKESLTKLNDQMDSYKKIKAAIYSSNSTTKVKIGDREMFVAEAIARRESLPFEEARINAIKRNITAAKSAYEAQMEKLTATAEEFAKQYLGNDASKKDPDAFKKTVDDFMSTRKPELILVISEDEVEKMESEMLTFKQDVDVVLSESNSTTYIEI